MIEFISINQKENWNRIVKRFDDWDIYYLNEYSESLMLHGDGNPLLVYWKNDSKEMCYVIMVEDISKSKQFFGILPEKRYFDATVPYGYGGPLLKGNFSDEDIEECMKSIIEGFKKAGIISQFFRFHPLLDNYKLFGNILEAKTFKSTIFIDTSSEDVIWKNMDSTNRNMIRKAIKSGVTIEFDKGDRVEKFISVYNSTMMANGADGYYYFDKKYYDFLINKMRENVIFAYSIIDKKVIGASILFYNNKFMHYHLSGTYKEYRQFASTNLLLFEAARYASRLGIEKFHLGGGMNSDDSLYKFKKKFNKYGEIPFYIGRIIADKDKYEFLLDIRKSNDESFDKNNGFMIQYRK